jgi:hypothetical protein
MTHVHGNMTRKGVIDIESILLSIKKLLGIADDYNHFDQDIIMHINSVFMVLTQIGIGPAEGFSITGESATWSDFVEEHTKIEAIRSYMYLKVRLLFDPPTNSAVIESMNNMIKEYEFRLNWYAETKSDSEEEIQNE